MDDTDILTETPEEKAFFDSQGAETVVVETPEPELQLEPQQKAEEPVKSEEPKKDDRVPLAVLLEERAERKKLYERLEKLQALIQPKEQPKPPADPETDPIGALKALQEKLNARERQDTEFQEVQQIASLGQQAANAFRQVKPDFDDAYNHLRRSRANQLMESGAVSTPQELNERILGEEKQIIQMCQNMGISPAAFMYHLANAAGYQVKEAPQAAAEPVQPTPEEKVKIIANGQQKASNPISKAGSSGNGPIDLKAVLKLDDDEFDKATSGNNWRKLAGG